MTFQTNVRIKYRVEAAIDITDKILSQKKSYTNCRLFVQTITGIDKIEDLPRLKTPKNGSIIWYGLTPKTGKPQYKHVALYIDDDTVLEVDEWGAKPRITTIDELNKEYDKPSFVFDTKKQFKFDKTSIGR